MYLNILNNYVYENTENLDKNQINILNKFSIKD